MKAVMEKIRVVYFGNSIKTFYMLQSIDKISVTAWIYQFGKVRTESLIYPDCYIESVNNKKELEESVQNNIKKFDIAIMYDFGIIIPSSVLHLLKVYNFHPGDLNTNRGSSPINWAILLGWKHTGISLYEISSEIDLGALISFHDCKIYPSDTPSSLKARLEGEIFCMIFELLEYIDGKTKSVYIKDGVYRKRIKEIDYTINPIYDSEDTIRAKIQSQRDYNGAILFINNREYRINSYEEYEELRKCFKEN